MIIPEVMHNNPMTTLCLYCLPFKLSHYNSKVLNIYINQFKVNSVMETRKTKTGFVFVRKFNDRSYNSQENSYLVQAFL